MSPSPSTLDDEGVSTAVKHALGWLVFGNAVGLYLSVLLIIPAWQVGEWTYGRWVPVHLNVQLYGWTALPLVAWLFSMYEVGLSKSAAWASATVWGWTAALAMGALHWLGGETGARAAQSNRPAARGSCRGGGDEGVEGSPEEAPGCARGAEL